MSIDFRGSRQVYQKDMLLEANVPNEPYILLQDWLQQAIDESVPEPYAFALATCGADNVPSVRTLLMRQIVQTDNGVDLIFYTNYDSQKGQDLAQNPNAEALFFWHKMERQIRLTGTVTKLSEADSIAYFDSRPRDSRLAAWVSAPQSGTVASREVMQARFAELSAQYGDTIAKPPFWGGYRLTANKIEFWQGRPDRMHDRLVYANAGQGWTLGRILP